MNYLEILIKLRKIIRSLNLESKRIEKEFSISIPQLLSLKFLKEQPDNISSAREIKNFLVLNASTVSGILSRLEDKGLVARLPKSEDRRVNRVVLTAKGDKLLEDAPPSLFEKLSGKLEKLDDNRLKELDRNIELLVHLLDAENLEATPILTLEEFDSREKK